MLYFGAYLKKYADLETNAKLLTVITDLENKL